jgi:hypothetical protein
VPLVNPELGRRIEAVDTALDAMREELAEASASAGSG